MKIIESDGFIERAVYYNGCVTNYLLKLNPEKTSKNNDESVHDIAFSSLVSSIHDDLFLHKKAFLISHLLDKYRSFLPNGVPNYWVTLVTALQFSHSAVRACQICSARA
jgi:hypothetical protein